MPETHLAKVKDFYQKNHRLPSFSEMMRMFGLSSKNSVHKMVKKWREKGLLKKEGVHFSPTEKFFQIPALGEVKAGFPTHAYENPELMSLDQYLVERPNSSFLLQVDGDSLRDIGIYEDDLVLLERTQTAQPGNIVLARIDEEWTLKIFRKKGRSVYLEAANDNYPTFYPKGELEIFGVVKGVVRKL